jgi:hypothetical protein
MHERVTGITKNIISLDNYEELGNIYPPESYKKLASILVLKNAGFPTLPGFVVSRLDKEALDTIYLWAAKTRSNRVSLRFDSPRVEDNVALSSLNPSFDELEKIAPKISPPVIGLVLAENDRYKQGHSILALFLEDRILCEIVGHGFDAADITRGNVTPHETIVIIRKDLDRGNEDLTMSDILSHGTITPEDYLNSRELRYGLIYSTINKELGKSVQPKIINLVQKEQVEKFLYGRGASIPEKYQPLGWEKLSKLYSYLAPLDMYGQYYSEKFGITSGQKVVSASFLINHGLVFWDFYDGRKYKPVHA